MTARRNKTLDVSWGRDPDIPAEMEGVAKRRIHDFVLFYGRFITTISLPQLAMSCYLQGCRDMAEVAIREVPKLTTEPGNYEI